MGSIDVTFDGVRADIKLRRPEVLNAFDWDAFVGLSKAVDEVAGAPDVRVVVVSGEGRSFSSGIDTSSLGRVAGDPPEMVATAQAGFRKLAALELPTIAAVQGHALGAGLQLALACDVRVVTEDASLGLLEGRYSLVPDLSGTQRLPMLVGPGRAKKMIWLAERVTGAEAEEIGLAEVVVAPADLDSTVNDLAARLAAASPLMVKAVKKLVDVAGRVSLEEGMDGEAAAQLQMFESGDFGEAISAFMEKRTPAFTGS